MDAESAIPASPDILAFEAMMLVRQGKYQEGINRCLEGLARYGPNVNLYLVKARAHLEMDELGFAEDALLSLLAIDTELPAAWAMLGEVYFRLGRPPRVESCRQRLRYLFPALEEIADVEPTTQENPIANQAHPSDSLVPLEEITTAGGRDILAGEHLHTAGDGTGCFMPESDLGSGLVPEPPAQGIDMQMFETPTFAEICLNQGKLEKALAIYSRLLAANPNNEEYQQKVKTIRAKLEKT